MEWPVLTAIAALAVAAIIVGALFLKVGEPLNYIPQCSDCEFFVKGPTALVQTEGAAYLVRGAELTPSSILAEYGWAYDAEGKPLRPGQSIYCERGMFVRVVGGIAQASCDVIKQAPAVHMNRTPLCVPGPANATWHELPKVPPNYWQYYYTLIPITWCGHGVVKIKVTWSYTTSRDGVVDGVYISLFVPTNYTKLVNLDPHTPAGNSLGILPYGGANYVPAGSPLQLFVQFNPLDYNVLDGSIEFAVMNVKGGVAAIQSRGFNPGRNWPTNTWTTYVIYNSTSNTLYVRWIVPGVFDVEYTYDLNTFGREPYRFTPPSYGKYYIMVGVCTGGGYADWRIHSIEYSVS